MDTKPRGLNLDWWVVEKRNLYLLVGGVALLILALAALTYVWLYGNPFAGKTEEPMVAAGARFETLEGDVRVVRTGTRENLTARADTQLYPGDIVQTQADGRARIRLVDGSTLVVRPNSVVTIRENTSSEGGGRTNVRVAVDRGQINLSTGAQNGNANNTVETVQTKNQLAGETGASFSVQDDRSEDIRVTNGSVQTTTRTGEQTTIGAGEYAAINQTGAVTRRERLLNAPVPVQPRELERITTGAGGAANVTLKWQRPAGGTPAFYSAEVATSPFFVAAGRVAEQEQVGGTELTVQNLSPGFYFWRVRATTASGQIGEWSDTRKFVVGGGKAGGSAKVLVDDIALEYVAGTIYIIRGRAAPGTRISYGERQTVTGGNGFFQIQVTAPRGASEVSIEAEDAQGARDRYRIALPAPR